MISTNSKRNRRGHVCFSATTTKFSIMLLGLVVVTKCRPYLNYVVNFLFCAKRPEKVKLMTRFKMLWKRRVTKVRRFIMVITFLLMR